MEDGAVSLWWTLWWIVAAFFAGGYLAVFVMSLMNMAAWESDRAEMSSGGMSGVDVRADD